MTQHLSIPGLFPSLGLVTHDTTITWREHAVVSGAMWLRVERDGLLNDTMTDDAILKAPERARHALLEHTRINVSCHTL